MIKVHLISLGCPKNLVDAEVMSAALLAGPFHLVAEPQEAEVIIVNTCAFILPAKEESIEEILAAALWKQKGECRYLVVTGCLPQRYGKTLAKELPEVDLFLDINEAPHITEHLQRLMNTRGNYERVLVKNPFFLMAASHERRLATPFYSAYLKIAEGCSNYCSYCIIPAIRGRARSRKIEDIMEEAEKLAAQGVKEIILIAQDTTAYGRDLPLKPTLYDLLKNLVTIDGVHWIRLLYTYPGELERRLLLFMAEEKKICPYIDMPIQHIDDDILKAMHRHGNSAHIKESINLIREHIPGVALRTSLMVGFPGESPAKFKKLVKFVEETKFDHLGVFTYSCEEETLAATFKGQITDKTKERRREKLLEVQARISARINASLIGKKMEVVIEGKRDHGEFPYLGRAIRQAPEIDGVTYVRPKGNMTLQVGDFVECHIIGADVYDLYGEVL